MNVEQVFSNSWKVYKKSWKKIFLIVLAYIAAIVVSIAIPMLAFGINESEFSRLMSMVNSTGGAAIKNVIYNFIWFVISALILVALVSVYFTSVMSSLAAKPNAPVKKIFINGNKKFFKLLGAEILLLIIMMSSILLAAVLIGIGALVPMMMRISALLSLIGLIYIKIKLIYVFPEIFLKDRGPVDSIKYSWKETKNFWTIFFVLIIIMLGSFVISILTTWVYTILNIFFLWPFTILCIFEMYKSRLAA